MPQLKPQTHFVPMLIVTLVVNALSLNEAQTTEGMCAVRSGEDFHAITPAIAHATDDGEGKPFA